MTDKRFNDVDRSYDRVAAEYAHRIYGELEHKPLDRQLLWLIGFPPYSLVVAVHLVGRESKVAIALLDAVIEAHPRIAALVCVVRGGYHLHAVDVSPDHVARNSRLDEIPVLDPVLRTGVFFQRSPITHFPVPPHDFHIGFLGLQASPEYLDGIFVKLETGGV